MGNGREQRYRLAAAAVALVLVATLSLTWHLGAASWATDEPVYRNAAVAIFDYGNWTQNLEHPPLAKVVEGASMTLFGEHHAWAVRLPSALATLVGGGLLAGFAMSMFGRGSDHRRQGEIAALATFAAWTLLPHPDPSFDVSRLGYLDALMTMFCAGALWAAWKWQRGWSWGWAVGAGALVGLALATKFPALFVLIGIPLLVLRRDDAPGRRRYLQLGALTLTAIVVALLPWMPLGGDVPHALRFAVAMQRRDVHQALVIAGHTYRSGAPMWAQLWWQWHAWPEFAVAELAAVVLAWWAMPRRAAVLVWASVLVPFVAFAAGGRILPHWQMAWEMGMAVLVGSTIGWLFTRTHARAGAVARVVGMVFAIALVIPIAQHLRAVGRISGAPSSQMRVASALAPADVAGGIVLDIAHVHVERDLIRALPANWSGTYHSAAYAQHAWVHRTGGRPLEPAPTRLRARTWTSKQLTGVVTPHDADTTLLPIASGDLHQHFVRHRAGAYDVWIRTDLSGT